MNWYYEKDSQQQGPIPESELDRLLQEGTITQDTLVWREGMDSWIPLRTARPVAPAGGAGMGTVKCDSCGGFFPASEVMQIGDRTICANCKPSAVQSISQGGRLPVQMEGDRTGPPWEQRQSLGTIKAAWETIKGVLGSPNETFSKMKRTGGLGSPLLFNVIVGSLGAIIGVLWQVAFEAAGGMAGAGGSTNGPGALTAMGLGVGLVLLIYVLCIPVLIALGAFITSGITHVSLMICGGAKQPFETTFRVLSYASASAGVLQIVPICGAIVGGIWGLVASCIGLARAHEIGTGRALIAILLPTFICLGLVVVFMVWIFGIASMQAMQ